jgi:hypothetical protein
MSANTQYDPNKLGWGAAILTCAFTAALGFTAYTIHKNTYRHPRDPMNVQVFHAEDMAKHEGGEAKHEGGEAKGEAEHAPSAEQGAAKAAEPAKH